MSKGDKWRKTNYKDFFSNFDNIKFKKKSKDTDEVKTVVKKNKTTYKY